MTSLRKIDFEKEDSFTCAGRTFYKSPLGFTRYKEAQKIMLELGFSATFVDIYNNTKKAIDAYNKHDYFNMSIIIYKIQEGIKNLDEKDHPGIRLCALILNEENEDSTKYNEAEMKSKIDCWASELEVFPFVNLALNIIPEWMNAYQSVIHVGLKNQAEKVE
jgi:hypothetical protein